ncbi:amino acid racemase [Candidatus Woesearchaeota archaeon]|nr:amino acid racemase [Candidatus Woesearchaeota archaeon]
MKKPKIGILGGIGPEATGQFYSRLISGLQRKGIISSNTDFPHIIINSIPAPELVFRNHSQDELEMYIKGLKQLEANKVDFIVIVCNTIHHFMDLLKTKIKTPILDLPEEIEKQLIQQDVKKITILGTPTTIQSDVFRFNSVENNTLTDAEIQILSEAILNFLIGNNKEEQINKVNKIARKYKDGSQVILGCTELSIMLGHNKEFIDTMDIMVETTIMKFLEFKQ